MSEKRYAAFFLKSLKSKTDIIVKISTIDTCKIMSYVFVLAHGILVIPAEAGIQGKDWIPHPPIKDFEGRQVRNDDIGHFYAGVNNNK